MACTFLVKLDFILELYFLNECSVRTRLLRFVRISCRNEAGLHLARHDLRKAAQFLVFTYYHSSYTMGAGFLSRE